MKMGTRVVKDGEVFVVPDGKLETYLSNGFKLAPPIAPKSATEVTEGPTLKPGQIVVWKDGDYAICAQKQLDKMLEKGWSLTQGSDEPTEDRSTNDGEQQLDGQQVDQEHGRGEGGFDLDREAVGQQLPESSGDDRAASRVGRKRKQG